MNLDDIRKVLRQPWPPKEPSVKFKLGATIHYKNLEGNVIEVLPEHNYRVEFVRFWSNNKLYVMDSSFIKVIHFNDLRLYDWGSDLGYNEDGTYIRWSEYFGD